MRRAARAGAGGRIAALAGGLLYAIQPAAAQETADDGGLAGEYGYVRSSSDFGGVGLMQTRTARFHPDGTLSVGGSFVDQYWRYYINFQPLPWVEATFRYTDVRNRLFSNVAEFSGDQSFKDRGADVKFLLLKEGDLVPQVAFGLQDALGTGLFSGEYLVGSKRWYDLDFSFGVGWGYPGNRGDLDNPLARLSDRFASRDDDFGQGGTLSIGNFLSGEKIGLFAGVEWFTPIEGLTLKLEYEGNDYQNDPLGNTFEQDVPFNVGFVYNPFQQVEIAGGIERGNVAMIRLGLKANPGRSGFPKFDPPPPPLKSRGAAEAAAPAAGPAEAAAVPPQPALPAGEPDVDALFDRLAALGLAVEGLETEGQTARLVLLDEGEAGEAVLAPTAEAAFAALPASLGRVELTLIRPQGEDRHVVLERSALGDARVADALFDRLEAEGWTVEGVAVGGGEARIRLAGAATPDAGLADRVMATLPGAVERVVFEVAGADGIRATTVDEAEAAAAGRVDALYAAAERRGFELLDLDLTDGRASARVRSTGVPAAPDVYRAFARSVAESVDGSVEEVRVMEGDDRAPRAVLYRSQLAARFVPDPPAGGVLVAELDEAERERLATRLFRALQRAEVFGEAVEIERDRVLLHIRPTRFREGARNIGRAARVAADVLPPQVEQITVATLSGGVEVSRVTLLRSDLERIAEGRGSPEEAWTTARIETPPGRLAFDGNLGDDAQVNPAAYPSFSWSLRPDVRQFIGGPEGFLLYDVFAKLNAGVQLSRGLSMSGELRRSLFGSFNDLSTPSNSVLPHVRSDVQLYLAQSQESVVLDSLAAEYAFQPAPDWFARAYAGLLESMFGGVGAEVLWRPIDSRLAISLDLNWVQQRTPEQRLEFRDYDVVTGHLGLHYQLPWYDMLGEIRAGQFLAGDKGAQFRLSRRFDNGIRVGAWATFTDVPFEDFGEGSFDKGFFVSVPLELFLLQSTRRVGTFAFRPLTRDGGAILITGNRLYGRTDDADVNALSRDWSTLWE